VKLTKRGKAVVILMALYNTTRDKVEKGISNNTGMRQHINNLMKQPMAHVNHMHGLAVDIINKNATRKSK